MSELVDESSFQLKINGELETVSPNQSLYDWLKTHDLEQKRIAIEVNTMIIPRSQWAKTYLKPQDQVEVIRAVGGG